MSNRYVTVQNYRFGLLKTEIPSSTSDFQTEIPSISSSFVARNESHPYQEAIFNQDGSEYESYGSYTGQEFGNSEGLNQNVVGGEVSSYGSYENYGNYGQCKNNLSGWSLASIPELREFVGNSSRGMGKRGKNEVIPTEIVEVKQDELMKDRPKEDHVKLTDDKVLVAAPRGSGKTIFAEITILTNHQKGPDNVIRVVYIAPLEPIAKELYRDWKKKFGRELGLHIVESRSFLLLEL